MYLFVTIKKYSRCYKWFAGLSPVHEQGQEHWVAGHSKTLNILPVTNTIFYLLNYSQVKMSANQSTMDVSIFVLALTIPTSASVVRDSHWEKMARPAEVSDRYLLNIFAHAPGKQERVFSLLTGKKSSFWYIFLICFHSKPVFISIIPRTGHLQISQPWLWSYLR